MKHFGKAWVFVVAVVAIASFCISIFGIATQYGDIKNVIINGTENLEYGSEFTGTVDIVLAPKAGKPDAAQLALTKSIVERRLAFYDIADYSVHCDPESGNVTARISADAIVSASWIADELTTIGDFKAYKGLEADESQLILSGRTVSKAIAGSETTMDVFVSYYVDVTLNSAGRAAYRAASDELFALKNETDTTQIISYWLDGDRIATTGVHGVVKNGRFLIESSVFEMNDASEIAVILNSGALPYEMEVQQIATSPARFGAAAYAGLQIAAIASFAAILLFLVIRYRVGGLLGFAALLGTCSSICFLLTGMFRSAYAVGIGGIVVMALFAALFLSLETIVRSLESVRAAASDGRTSVQKAVSDGFKKNLSDSLCLNAAAFAVGVFMLALNRGTNTAASIIAPILNSFGVTGINLVGLADCGAVLVSYAVFGVLFNVLGLWVMCGSLSGFAFAKNPKIFGGSNNA